MVVSNLHTEAKVLLEGQSTGQPSIPRYKEDDSSGFASFRTENWFEKSGSFRSRG